MPLLVDDRGLKLSASGNQTVTVKLENKFGVHVQVLHVMSGSNPSGMVSLNLMTDVDGVKKVPHTGGGTNIPATAKTSSYSAHFNYVGAYQELTLTSTAGDHEVYVQYFLRN